MYTIYLTLGIFGFFGIILAIWYGYACYADKVYSHGRKPREKQNKVFKAMFNDYPHETLVGTIFIAIVAMAVLALILMGAVALGSLPEFDRQALEFKVLWNKNYEIANGDVNNQWLVYLSSRVYTSWERVQNPWGDVFENRKLAQFITEHYDEFVPFWRDAGFIK